MHPSLLAIKFARTVAPNGKSAAADSALFRASGGMCNPLARSIKAHPTVFLWSAKWGGGVLTLRWGGGEINRNENEDNAAACAWISTQKHKHIAYAHILAGDQPLASENI